MYVHNSYQAVLAVCDSISICDCAIDAVFVYFY